MMVAGTPQAHARSPFLTRRYAHCMIRRVLAALDGSPRAPGVLSVALDIARGSGASVRLYQAVAIPPEFPPSAATRFGDPLPEHLRERARHQLEGLAAGVTGVACDVVVDDGDRPWRAILAAADRYDADLIVLGSLGYDLVDRVLGTTAARVANTSHRNVLVVHRDPGGSP